MKSNWRVILAGLLLAASIWVFALSRYERGAVAPAWHENDVAGFRIRPPAGWSERTDDRDGTQIAPPIQPSNGFAMLIVSTRLARDEDPMAYISDAVARAPSGPIQDLVWLTQERITLEDGGRGGLGEFTEIYRGKAVHGWMVVSVREGKLLQAVATVPQDRADSLEDSLLGALRSVQPL